MTVERVADRTLWGAVAIVVNLVVLAVAVLYAWRAGPDPAEPAAPRDAEEGWTYTCHCLCRCHRDPVRGVVRPSELPVRAEG